MATARVPQPSADDPVRVDPKHYHVEFENDRVRVVRIKYGPGEKSVMHSHPESVAVGLTDAPVRVQAFLSQSPVEALRIGVLHRLAGLDELQSHPSFFAPGR
jgi:hypothetical protein